MSRPSIENLRLAREGALQETLERLDLRDALEQFVAVDRIVRRTELPGLHGLTQPDPLVGDEHVVVVVAGGGAVDLAQLRDRVERVRGARGRGPGDDRRRQLLQRLGRQAVRLRRERRIADRIVKAERIEARGEVPEAANRLGKIEGGDACLKIADGLGPAFAAEGRSGEVSP